MESVFCEEKPLCEMPTMGLSPTLHRANPHPYHSNPEVIPLKDFLERTLPYLMINAYQRQDMSDQPGEGIQKRRRMHSWTWGRQKCSGRFSGRSSSAVAWALVPPPGQDFRTKDTLFSFTVCKQSMSGLVGSIIFR